MRLMRYFLEARQNLSLCCSEENNGREETQSEKRIGSMNMKLECHAYILIVSVGKSLPFLGCSWLSNQKGKWGNLP